MRPGTSGGDRLPGGHRSSACRVSGRRVIAVTEAAKLSRTGLAFVAPASALHTVMTEDGADQQETEALAAAGVTVRKV